MASLPTVLGISDIFLSERSFTRICLWQRHEVKFSPAGDTPWAVSQALVIDPRRCSLFPHLVSHVRVSLIIPPHLPLYINMLLLRHSKIPSLRPLGAEVSSSPLRRRRPLSSLSPSFTRNLTTIATNRLPSRRLSNMLDPVSLMTNLESEIFNYTTGRFLYVSYIFPRLCLTSITAYSAPTTPITSESANAYSTSPDSSNSLLRR